MVRQKVVWCFLCDELGVPIKYVGLGEEISDLEPFEPEKFAQALFDFDV